MPTMEFENRILFVLRLRLAAQRQQPRLEHFDGHPAGNGELWSLFGLAHCALNRSLAREIARTVAIAKENERVASELASPHHEDVNGTFFAIARCARPQFVNVLPLKRRTDFPTARTHFRKKGLDDADAGRAFFVGSVSCPVPDLVGPPPQR